MSTKIEMDKEDELRPVTPPPQSPKPKKKKRKTYKQMMKDLLKPKKKKEAKLTGLGGGEFSKIVKI